MRRYALWWILISKEKEYCQSLEDYLGNLLLVGINYDVKTKEHSCVIEEFVK